MTPMSDAKNIRAAYTGTFDPLTNGHVDVIGRAADLFSELIVAVGSNSSKNSIFNPEERVELTRAALADLGNVRVKPATGLIVDFARAHDVRVLVRGVRGVMDYEYEKQMALMNRHMTPEIETLLLMPAPEYAHISSTLVREIATLGDHLDGLVPAVVAERLRAKLN
jgi:pantetheine-phosphate adenylyltransferase